MNRPLMVLDHHIRDTCRELMAAGGRVSGRALRRALRERYGAAGKTDRVFQVWREETESKSEAARPRLPTDIAELQRRLIVAEEAAKENLARAERAELREQAHQDRWAMEVDRLRQEVRAQPRYAAEIRALQERVFRLTVELHAERQLISENK
jgi:predicted RNase H-like nuclease (RuvC/YqgF family)